MSDRKRKREKRTRTFGFLNLAFKCAEFKGVTRLVLLALADRAGQSGMCWCGYEDIMRRTNASRGAVAESLDRLTAYEVDGVHLLKREKRFRDGRQISNIYTFNRKVLEGLSYEEETPAKSEESDEVAVQAEAKTLPNRKTVPSTASELGDVEELSDSTWNSSFSEESVSDDQSDDLKDPPNDLTSDLPMERLQTVLGASTQSDGLTSLAQRRKPSRHLCVLP